MIDEVVELAVSPEGATVGAVWYTTDPILTSEIGPSSIRFVAYAFA